MVKFQDLKKGKKSQAYKKSIGKFTKLQRFKEAQKNRDKFNIAIQEAERARNLDRLLKKGLISQEEYNLKKK